MSFLVKAHASVNIYTTLFECSRALRALQLWSQRRCAKSQPSPHRASLCWSVFRVLFLKSYFWEFPSVGLSLFLHSHNPDKGLISSVATTVLFYLNLSIFCEEKSLLALQSKCWETYTDVWFVQFLFFQAIMGEMWHTLDPLNAFLVCPASWQHLKFWNLDL